MGVAGMIINSFYGSFPLPYWAPVRWPISKLLPIKHSKGTFQTPPFRKCGINRLLNDHLGNDLCQLHLRGSAHHAESPGRLFEKDLGWHRPNKLSSAQHFWWLMITCITWVCTSRFRRDSRAIETSLAWSSHCWDFLWEVPCPHSV